MLERADKTARILDVKYFTLLPTPDYFDSPYDTVEWGALLKSVSAFEMYQKKYHRANYRDVTDFLVFDPDFPRALRYCIGSAASSLTSITKMINVKSPAEAEMSKLKSMIEDTDVDAVLARGLHEFVDVFQFNLNVVDVSLYRSFFALDRE